MSNGPEISSATIMMSINHFHFKKKCQKSLHTIRPSHTDLRDTYIASCVHVAGMKLLGSFLVARHFLMVNSDVLQRQTACWIIIISIIFLEWSGLIEQVQKRPERNAHAHAGRIQNSEGKKCSGDNRINRRGEVEMVLPPVLKSFLHPLSFVLPVSLFQSLYSLIGTWLCCHTDVS